MPLRKLEEDSCILRDGLYSPPAEAGMKKGCETKLACSISSEEEQTHNHKAAEEN
jgi:hypothetical protein